MLLRRALPAAHFYRNATTPVTDLVHWQTPGALARGALSSPPARPILATRLDEGERNVSIMGWNVAPGRGSNPARLSLRGGYHYPRRDPPPLRFGAALSWVVSRLGTGRA